MDEITITIDGQTLSVPPGITILQAARSAGVDIPTICYHDATTPNALCRTCVVEVDGARVLAASCVARVSDGMKVNTRSERVERSRRTILEMLAEYEADSDRFPGAERRQPPVIDDNPMYVRDYAKCVLCWRCVQVCAEDAQYTYAINFTGRGFETQIGTFFDQPMPETTCVFCGQCVGVCPTGALKPKREWLFEQGLTPDEIMQSTRSQRKRKRSAE